MRERYGCKNGHTWLPGQTNLAFCVLCGAPAQSIPPEYDTDEKWSAALGLCKESKMQTYRSKPAKVQAMLFTGEPAMVQKARKLGANLLSPTGPAMPWKVRTLEGFVQIPRGHYLICGMKGEWYPCDPEVFAARWELDE